MRDLFYAWGEMYPIELPTWQKRIQHLLENVNIDDELAMYELNQVYLHVLRHFYCKLIVKLCKSEDILFTNELFTNEIIMIFFLHFL